jgi:dTDP-glucose 4,6-dehydratase
VGEEELSVKTIAIKILKAINRINDDTLTADQVCYVKDRLYNDKRYEMDSSAIRELGWQPKIDFNSGLQETILWYRQSGQHWWGK